MPLIYFEVLSVFFTFLNSRESVAALAPDVWEISYNMFQKVPVWLHLSGGKKWNKVCLCYSNAYLAPENNLTREEGISELGLTNLCLQLFQHICRKHKKFCFSAAYVIIINIHLVVPFNCKCLGNIAECSKPFWSLRFEEVSVLNILHKSCHVFLTQSKYFEHEIFTWCAWPRLQIQVFLWTWKTSSVSLGVILEYLIITENTGGQKLRCSHIVFLFQFV